MNKKTVLLGVVFSLTLGFASNQIFSADEVTKAASTKVTHAGEVIHKQQSKVEDVLKETPYNVKLPDSNAVPFKVKNTAAHNMRFHNKIKFSVEYNGENNELLILEVVDTNLKTINSEDSIVQNVQLQNGVSGQYIENGYCQMLSWNQDGKGYLISYTEKLQQSDKKSFQQGQGADKLIIFANSIIVK